jgi:histidinol-phosphatase (PHP family)
MILISGGGGRAVVVVLPADGWHEEGGEAVTFGSDAHAPTGLAHRFADAASMVEAQGFRSSRHPYDYWSRSH